MIKLKEWADNFDYKNTHYNYHDAKTIVFGYKSGVLVAGHTSGHAAIGIDTFDDRKLTNNYAGRVYIVPKVLSFWGYPGSKSKLFKIIKDLNRAFPDLKIDSSWSVEIPKILLTKNYVIQKSPGRLSFDMEDALMDSPTGEKHYESVFIPIDKYNPEIFSKSERSTKSKKDALLKHNLSPVAKSEVPTTGIGSNKRPGGLTATQRHQMSSTSEGKIKESPDGMDVDYKGSNINIGYGEGSDYAFGYYEGKFYIQQSYTHYALNVKGDNIERKDFDYPGRLWKKYKIISFWKYPETKKKLLSILADIGKELHEHINPSEWLIDVVLNNKFKSAIKTIIDTRGNENYDLKNAKEVLIPVLEYEGSLDNNMNIKHMISPILKAIYGNDIPKGWGWSKRPAGLPLSKLHQLQTTSDGIIKLKSLIESPDQIEDLYGDIIAEYEDVDAYPFYFDTETNILYAGNEGETHGAINPKPPNMDRWRWKETSYVKPGRIWLEPKIMSFWIYPDNKHQMKNIADALSKEFNVDVWNDFDVEIYEDLVGIKAEDDIIPVKDYTTSEDPPEEEKIQHLLSPMKKKVGKVPSGWGSEKIPAGLTATRIHQMQTTADGIIKLKTLVESPDTMRDPKTFNKIAYVTDGDAFPFYYGYNNSKLYIANEPYKYHGSIPNIPENFFDSGRRAMGRIWIDKKLISFWGYPESRKEMREVADAMDKYFYSKYGYNLNVWNNFSVDIYGSEYDNDSYELIPVRDYRKSEEPPEEEKLQHLLSPMQKKDRKVPSGWGSEKIPAGLTATKRQQMQRTSDGIIKLKNLIESPDKLWKKVGEGDDDYESYAHWSDADAYPFYYLRGKIYTSKEPGTNHPDMELEYSPLKRRMLYEASIIGRIWLDKKIISFWGYPKNNSEMKKVADALSKYFHVNVWRDFSVESKQDVIIPIQYYEKGVPPPPEEKLQHLLSPMKKKDVKVPKGWGSGKTAAGLSATKLHQMASTSENKK